MFDLIDALDCLIGSLKALSQVTQIESAKAAKRTIASRSKLIINGNGWQLMSIGSQTELWHYQPSHYNPNLWVWRPHILDWQIVRELLEIAIEEGYQKKVESVMRSESFVSAIAWQFDRSKDLILTLSMPSLSMTVKRFHIWDRFDKLKPIVRVVKLIKN